MNKKTPVPLKVLLVDDESEFLQVATKLLQPTGFDVLVANSASAALDFITEHANEIALVISDLNMKGEGGLELRGQMMNLHKEIPFVVLSGYVTREVALKGVELRISAFLNKPIQQKDLLEVVQRETQDRIRLLQEEAELLEGFLQEADILIEEMEGLVLALEDAPQDVETLNRIFACAHTIKGASGYFKPDTIHKFTHSFEDYLSQFKKDPTKTNSTAISIFLKGLDALKMLLNAMRSRKESSQPLDVLKQIFAETTVSDPDMLPSEARKQQSQAALETRRTEELRVSVNLLDAFMERSGELTVLRNMINKVVRMIEVENPANANVVALTDLLAEMHKANAFMQDQVVDLRKVPLKQIYKPLSRTVRDLSISLKKPLSLSFSGDDLRVDHTVAEILSKCLIHIIRNAADHGIEPAEVRASFGKPVQGSISIVSEITGETVVIKVKDDGKGIDPKAVKAKAIEKQVVTKTQADQMTDAEIRMLIFEPGFSTSEVVTDVSGRGVGTDMVKKSVLQAGGKIELRSEIGVGSEFVLMLPVPKSVLIISSLLIKCCGYTFAIPQDAILRVLKLDEAQRAKHIRKIKENRFFCENGSLLPIIELQNQLGAVTDKKGESDFLITLRGKSGDFCVCVEEIHDIEDTVVKKIGGWLEKIDLYDGATFLGDGRVGLILSVDGLAKRVGAVKEPVQHNKKTEDFESNKNLSANTYLLFDLGTRCLYATHQSQIYRLEDFSKEKVQLCGRQPVLMYRNHTMPLYFLSDILGDSEKEEGSVLHESENRNRYILVHSNGTRFFGFIIEKIEDFIQVESQLFEVAESERTSAIIQDKTVNVLNLRSLVSGKLLNAIR